MQIIKLTISDYSIDLIPKDNLELKIDPVYNLFFRNEAEADVCIFIHSWENGLIAEKQSDFAAQIPFINGNDLPQRDWHIYKEKNNIFIKVYSSFEKEKVEILIQINDSKHWNIYIHDDLCKDNVVEPLLHPVGSLLLYYLTSLNGDIFLHSSGIYDKIKGRIFSGFSGAGKSTMAKIWEQSGAEIIHDDRLILRKKNGNWFMHNTPVYLNDYPKSAKLNELFIVHHASENGSVELTGANAAARLFAFCIQHDFDKSVVAKLLNSVAELCSQSKIYALGFVPDAQIVNYIRSLNTHV